MSKKLGIAMAITLFVQSSMLMWLANKYTELTVDFVGLSAQYRAVVYENIELKRARQ